jgi:tetratricopeptide (TPR) repeat protein
MTDPDQLARDLETATRTGDVDALNLLATTLGDAGQPARAAAIFRVAASFGDDVAFSNLGTALTLMGDLEGAQAAYEAAIGLGLSEARVDLAMVLVETGDDEERVDELLTAAAQDGEPDAAHQLGLLRLRQSRTAEALPFLERARDEDPTGTVLDSLARGYRAAGRLDEALELFALAADEGYHEAHLSRAFTLADADRYEEAETSFRAAVEHDVDVAPASWAAALEHLDRPEEALGVLRAAADRGDSSAMIDLGNRLTEDAETFDEGLFLYRRAMALGDLHAVTNLAVSIRGRDRGDERATALLRQAAAEGDGLALRHRAPDDEAVGDDPDDDA